MTRVREEGLDTPSSARFVRGAAAGNRRAGEHLPDQDGGVHPGRHRGTPAGRPAPGIRERGIAVNATAERFMFRHGRARAGLLVTRDALIDLLARCRPDHTAVETVAQQTPRTTSYNYATAPAPVLRRLGPYAGALILIALLVPLHNLWAVQVLLVPLLLVVPGAILLQALRVPRLIVSSFPIYVPCASLIVLLGSGLAVDLVGPLIGVAAPLRAGPLLAGIEVTSTALLVASINAPPSVAIRWQWPSRPAQHAWPLILPLMAVVGALRLNNGHSSGVAVLTVAACIAVLITAVILSSRLDESLLAVILFASCLAMMWSRSLRSALIPGWDITSEYYDLHQAVLTGIWHTNHPGDAYGAMLSVTVMPAELHFLSGVPDLLVFSVVYPAIGALLPIAVFSLARRILSRRWAFIAATFIIIQAFQDLPTLARQTIATVFFAALIAAMLDARIPRRPRWALVALLSLAMVLSHYSTTYFAISLIGLMLPLQWVMSWFRDIPRVTGAVAVAFVAALAGAFIWYGQVTHFNSGLGPLIQGLKTQGFDLLPSRTHGKSLFAAYLEGNSLPPIAPAQYAQLVHASYALHEPYIIPLPDAHLRQYALQNPPQLTAPVRWPTVNNSFTVIWTIVQQLANVLSAVGALLMVLRRKTGVIIWQIGLLALAAVVWLTLIKLSATLANFYNWERALLQTLVLLSISLCWSMQCFAGWRVKREASILAIAAASLTVLFISASGLINVVVGGETPLSLANSGEDFNRYYFTAPELASARWLGEAAHSSQFVYADRYAQLRLFALYNNLTLIGDVTPLTLNQHAWVYASRTNVIDHRAEVLFDGSTVTYRFPASFLNANYDLVYTNGSSEVFHR